MLALLSWLRDELMPSNWNLYHLKGFLPDWPWYLWLAIAILLLGIALAEGAFRERRLELDNNPPKAQLIDGRGAIYAPIVKRGKLNKFGLPGIVVGIIIVCWISVHSKQSPVPSQGQRRQISISSEELNQLKALDDKKRSLQRTLDITSTEVEDAKAKSYVADERLRALSVSIEKKMGGCIIDMKRMVCIAKPPESIRRRGFRIDVLANVVTDTIAESQFWLVSGNWRHSAPIALLIRLTNEQNKPDSIYHLSVETMSDKGWQLVPLVGELTGAQSGEVAIVRNSFKDAAIDEDGNLATTISEKTFMPHDKAQGWILAEFPDGVHHGPSIGDIRIALFDASYKWIGATVLHSHPPKEPKAEMLRLHGSIDLTTLNLRFP